MSLIHWWSLDKDLKDKITLSTVGGTYTKDSNGKIGSCLKSSYPGFQTSVKLVDEWSHWKHSVSMSCWVKINYDECNTYLKTLSYSSTATSPTGCLIGQTSYGGLGIYWYTNTMYNNGTITDLTTINFRGYTRGSSSIATTSPITVESDKWYHMTLVADYNKKVLKFYVNGLQIGADTSYASIPEMTDVRYFGWGRGEVYGGNGPGGYLPMWINDIRLYDHALSQAEVKELSRALVVHYTFNDVLAEPTTNIAELITSGSNATYRSWSSYDSYWSLKSKKSTSLKIYRPSSSTNTIVALQNSAITNQMVEGEIWTFSCYLYKNGTPYKTSNFEISDTYYNYKTISCESQDNGYYSNTFEVIGTPGAWIIHSNLFGSVNTKDVECELRYIQFEKKDHATPYALPSRASLIYNETGLSQPSTKNNILLTTDSGIGMYSLKCQGNTEIIMPNACDISQGVTISFWVKCSIPTDSRLIFADSHSQTAFGFFNNGQAIITCAGYGHACVSNIRTNWKYDWNHIIIQRNSSGNVSCYLNGVQLSLSGSQEWTHSVTDTLSIGCRYSGGWTSYFSGLIDDFRFYATCLSVDDIKDLYQTKAYISDKGDIMCNEFIDGKAQAKVTSKGTFEAHEFYEEETNASIYDTQNVSGRNLIEI